VARQTLPVSEDSQQKGLQLTPLVYQEMMRLKYSPAFTPVGSMKPVLFAIHAATGAKLMTLS